MKISPETINVHVDWLHVIVLSEAPILCKRSRDDFVNRIPSWLLIYVGVKELSDGGKNEFPFARVESFPRLLALSMLPDVVTLEEANIHLPKPYGDHGRIVLDVSKGSCELSA